MKRIVFIVLLVMLIGCVGCSSAANDASTAAEKYQQAFAAKDADQVAKLSCKDWEEQALMEMDSFQAVETRLEGLTCSETGQDGDFTLVQCEGKILTTYGEEQREFDLSTRTLEMFQQDSVWLVCGMQ